MPPLKQTAEAAAKHKQEVLFTLSKYEPYSLLMALPTQLPFPPQAAGRETEELTRKYALARLMLWALALALWQAEAPTEKEPRES